mmetsp:Transcript_2884/g.9403  ORF Transcript_2884/g.9403 Transcript_2884/m.9403 type:complete len:325 (-) Transcript_2884:2207-3181(-)
MRASCQFTLRSKRRAQKLAGRPRRVAQASCRLSPRVGEFGSDSLHRLVRASASQHRVSGQRPRLALVVDDGCQAVNDVGARTGQRVVRLLHRRTDRLEGSSQLLGTHRHRLCRQAQRDGRTAERYAQQHTQTRKCPAVRRAGAADERIDGTAQLTGKRDERARRCRRNRRSSGLVRCRVANTHGGCDCRRDRERLSQLGVPSFVVCLAAALQRSEGAARLGLRSASCRNLGYRLLKGSDSLGKHDVVAKRRSLRRAGCRGFSGRKVTGERGQDAQQVCLQLQATGAKWADGAAHVRAGGEGRGSSARRLLLGEREERVRAGGQG